MASTSSWNSIALVALDAGAQQTREPGAEEARIGYFAGRWTIEFDFKMGAGAKFTVSETCEWFAGGFHLICRAEGEAPLGTFTQQAIIAYDPTDETYTYYETHSSGASLLSRGSVSGAVWRWSAETTVQGKRMKGRTTTTELTPTSYVARYETAVEGGPWTIVWEASATRTQ